MLDVRPRVLPPDLPASWPSRLASRHPLRRAVRSIPYGEGQRCSVLMRSRDRSRENLVDRELLSGSSASTFRSFPIRSFRLVHGLPGLVNVRGRVSRRAGPDPPSDSGSDPPKPSLPDLPGGSRRTLPPAYRGGVLSSFLQHETYPQKPAIEPNFGKYFQQWYSDQGKHVENIFQDSLGEWNVRAYARRETYRDADPRSRRLLKSPGKIADCYSA